jgi:hypothetical protein
VPTVAHPQSCCCCWDGLRCSRGRLRQEWAAGASWLARQLGRGCLLGRQPVAAAGVQQGNSEGTGWAHAMPRLTCNRCARSPVQLSAWLPNPSSICSSSFPPWGARSVSVRYWQPPLAPRPTSTHTRPNTQQRCAGGRGSAGTLPAAAGAASLQPACHSFGCSLRAILLSHPWRVRLGCVT